MTQVIPLFSVPIYVTQLEGHEVLQRSEVMSLMNMPLEKQVGHDGNYLSKSAHVLRDLDLMRIKHLCDAHVHHYTEHVLGIENSFKMFSSWLSMNRAHTKHLAHSHRNTMISCVLYFDEHMSDQPLAPIHFGQSGLDQVFKTFQFEFQIKTRNQYNNKILTVYPRTHTLIIFPGWITHETDAATHDIRRYCLGTNYFLDGESSGGYHRVHVNIT